MRLQASWAGGQVVVWAAGPDAAPASNDELADRLEAIGGPALGWSLHPAIPLPTGARAAALSIPVSEALGWLAAVGGGLGRDGVGASVTWLGRVTIAAVRHVARGRVVPTLRSGKRPDGRVLDLSVRWAPALVDEAELATFAAAMPGPVTALAPADPRAVTLSVLESVVDAVVTAAASRLELPAPPPVVRTSSDVAEAVVTRLDGSSFVAPVAAGAEVSKRLDRWARAVTGRARPTLVVQLDPPDSSDAWFLSVLGRGAEGNLLPVEIALADSRSTKPVADELARLERLLPALLRPGALRRGPGVPEPGRGLGADDRRPARRSRPPASTSGCRRCPAASRSRRCTSGPTAPDTMVGANQLANVRWTAVFDDVELTAADISRLAERGATRSCDRTGAGSSSTAPT